MRTHRLPGSAIAAAAGLLAAAPAHALLDQNGNQQSDVWEMLHGAPGLPGNSDVDGDGWSQAEESLAGTDPLDAASHPLSTFDPAPPGFVRVAWPSIAGKLHTPEFTLALATPTVWTPAGTPTPGTGGWMTRDIALPQSGPLFTRVLTADTDTDGDGLTDWEELTVRFNPASSRTDRFATLDAARVASGLTAPSTVTVSIYDDRCSERWPDPIVFVVRRSGGLQPLAVPLQFTGTASPGTDYAVAGSTSTAVFGPGQREVFIEVKGLPDGADGEPDESVTLNALAGPGYTLGSATSATGWIEDEPAGSAPHAKEAARFLLQAAFGPSQDSASDTDGVPENVEEVINLGFEGWIADQIQRPHGWHRPFVQWALAQPASAEIYNDVKQDAWWGRAMGLPRLRPDAVTTQSPDPLRQRVAFALSQIFVISDRMEDLAVSPEGMAAYYDVLVAHALGNYRDLLRDVALHPCMGIYLSHLGNRKADPSSGRFPDENFAREIMQLLSIGLWELNPDGSRVLDSLGDPVPTYDNGDITEMARVFTGLAFGGASSVNFGLWPRDFTVPMAGWDEEHDLGPKMLLRGVTTPARTASPGRTGTATLADVDAAIDCLFHHPNVGPFIGRQLIQRLVTSNPSPAYVARVSAAFADDGTGTRGNLAAVVRAILIDPEARDPAHLDDPTYGKLREPFLRVVNIARAFDAASDEGWYYLDAFLLDHAQEPHKSPSVFNFFLPTYAPPGPLTAAGLVAPEFQIVNASSGTLSANYFWNALTGGLHRWGVARPERSVTLNLDQEMLLNVPAAAVGDPYPSLPALDPDALLRRLDLAMTGGTLEPRSFQLIREALVRIGPFSGWDWPRRRLLLGLYLVANSAEFAVQR